MQRIVLFRGSSAYGVMDEWIFELQTAFAGMGYEPLLVDLTNLSQVQNALKIAFQNPALCYVGFNAQGSELEREPLRAFQKAGRPYLGILIDHPVLQHERLMHSDPYLRFTCVDRKHQEYAEKVYPDGKYSFLPHAASLSEEQRSPEQERTIPHLFLGSFRNPETRRAEWSRASDSFCRLTEEIVEEIELMETFDYYQNLVAMLEGHQIEPSVQCLQELHLALSEADLYLRETKRKKLLDSLDSAGIPVDVYGSGWEECSYRNHRIYGAVSYRKALDLMTQAQIILDCNPNFPMGLHERFLSGMANGALVFSDRNLCCDPEIVSGESYLSYDCHAPEALLENLLKMQNEPETRVRIARNGQARVMQAHLWAHRAEELLRLLSP